MDNGPVNPTAYHGIGAFPRDRTSPFWDKLRMADAVTPERIEGAVSGLDHPDPHNRLSYLIAETRTLVAFGGIQAIVSHILNRES